MAPGHAYSPARYTQSNSNPFSLSLDRTRGPMLWSMQTRYLLLASLVTGLVILVAAAVWMATRL